MARSATSRMTAEELLALPDDHMRHELIRGELTTMTPAGSEHGAISVRIGSALHGFVSEHGLGVVFGAETGFYIESDPDTVRAPDAAFIRSERIAALGIPRGYFPGAPDLAAEVVSPDDSKREVREKVAAWLAAGVEVVWVVDPRTRTVMVHERDGTVSTLDESETLTGGDLLPGWSCDVAGLFP
jgi:Uma2 family endonuclease